MIPRNEYPRPQLVRDEWTNLNGKWYFQIDNEMSGEEKGLISAKRLNQKIIVPFCPESELSGIGNTDFMNCVWYKKIVEFSSTQINKRIILHFGAVDYRAVVYINGERAFEHRGGYTPFSIDITDFSKVGENDITVCAYDDLRSGNQMIGKQSKKLESQGCSYTRTTGIWQTVWLEFLNCEHIKSVNYDSDPQNGKVIVTLSLTTESIGCKLSAKALWNGKEVGRTDVSFAESTTLTFSIDLSEIHLWDLGQGNLYDIEFILSKDNNIHDEVKSYFGLRTAGLDKRAFLLNGRRVFGRWVLDQGFYPDGIYTAPTDEALKNDICYSMQLGFNGARLHEKIFEPRFLYWADKLGYIVWDEAPNWGLNICEMGQIQYFLPEWLEVIKRDMSHPSIIGWCPFNETGARQCDEILNMVYHITKALDPSRPVIDTSGNFHVITDIFDVHDYEQDPEKFASYYKDIDKGIVNDQIARDPILCSRQKYTGKEPVFISEYGGIGWKSNTTDGWGYGDVPKIEKEFIERYDKLTSSMLNNKYILGFCYTQLYDVEQEQNGLMTYDRKFKFDPEIFKEINTKKAAIEK